MAEADEVGLGTHEQKRRQKAVPNRTQGPGALGCMGLSLACAATMALVGLWKHNWFMYVPAGAFGIGALFGLYVYLRELVVLATVRARWTPQGIRCLIVHSNSEIWQEHIATNWLTRLGGVAKTLNWSERGQWKSTLEVRVFSSFCGSVNFNPAVVVFRGLKQPYVFRFYYAFQQAKIGRPHYLEELEKQMFEAVGPAYEPATPR